VDKIVLESADDADLWAASVMDAMQGFAHNAMRQLDLLSLSVFLSFTWSVVLPLHFTEVLSFPRPLPSSLPTIARYLQCGRSSK
jgi:hypothetical protein